MNPIDSNQEYGCRLIEMHSENECLWNAEHENFKKTIVKAAIWGKFALILKLVMILIFY